MKDIRNVIALKLTRPRLRRLYWYQSELITATGMVNLKVMDVAAGSSSARCGGGAVSTGCAAGLLRAGRGHMPVLGG